MIKKLSLVLLMSLCIFSGCTLPDAAQSAGQSGAAIPAETEEQSVSETALPATGASGAPSSSDIEGIPLTFTEETAVPDAEWQLDVTFPDWKGDISSELAVNNCVGFNAFKGQGKIYLDCEGESDGFELFINGKQVDTSAVQSGTSCMADISLFTVNGMNSIQLSNVDTGKIRVRIPYPVVSEGTPEEVGIDPEAFRLIDRIISADVKNGFPSAQLAVVKDGKLVYEQAWCDAATDTLYDLASNTKMYSVNYAIQYLLTRGQINLDSRIVDILGESFSSDTIKIDYEGYDAVPLEINREWKEELTIRDLLRHQGGFPPGPHYYNDRYDHATQEFDSDKGNVIYVGTGGDLKAREETWKAICQTPLMYEPGTETVYSDLDYMILCYCIEEITGQRMDEYLSEVFFQPMGLDHITYNPLKSGFTAESCAPTELMGNTREGRLHYSGIRKDTIRGEVHDPNAYYCMAGISGHAGLFSNASDLAKLASVMLTGGYGDQSYFSKDVIDLFTAPKSEANPNYGLGWWREGDHKRDHYFGSITTSQAIGHQGFTGTLTMIDPDHDLVVVLLTNKISTEMIDPDETLSKWYGNYYVTGTLGFAPQIIEMGLGDEPADKGVWDALVSDMAADAKRKLDNDGVIDEADPRMKAYKSLLSVMDRNF